MVKFKKGDEVLVTSGDLHKCGDGLCKTEREQIARRASNQRTYEGRKWRRLPCNIRKVSRFHRGIRG